MMNPLLAKLSVAGVLLKEDCDVLQRLLSCRRNVPAHHELTSEGDRPENVHLVLQGFACRYKIQRNGTRTIMAILVPGDFCDLHVTILGHMDHSIATLSACSVVLLSRAQVVDLLDHPRIGRALLWASLVDEAVLREWVVNLGGREGDKRIAHLFCELLLRLRTVGLADDRGYELGFTQSDLADLTGMTNVHVNRVLKDLRARNLVTFVKGRVHIFDEDALNAFCEFQPNYLHLVPRTNVPEPSLRRH